MATLYSLFQQPGTAFLIGLLISAGPLDLESSCRCLGIAPSLLSHLQPTALVYCVVPRYTCTAAQADKEDAGHM